MEMEQFLRHSTRPDHTGSSRSRNRTALLVGRWLWPPTATDAAARQDVVPAAAATAPSQDELWRMNTMRWVPLVVPLAALFMLLLAVLIGSRL
jgi:hypothetical protein